MAKAKKVKKVLKVKKTSTSKVQAKIKAKVTAKTKVKPKAKTAAVKKVAVKAKELKKIKSSTNNNANLTKTSLKTSSATNKVQILKVTSKSATKNNILPLADRIVVRAINNKEKKTAGGLYIPDTVQMDVDNKEAIVIAVGRGSMDKKGRIRPIDLKAGTKIIFSKYAGDTFELNGEDLLFIREKDILGVVE